MSPNADNCNPPEDKILAEDLLRTLFKDKDVFVWDLYREGLLGGILYILSSDVLLESDKAKLIATRLAEAAQYCQIKLDTRAQELVALMPSLKTWLCDSTPLVPKDNLSPTLPVFQPPTDISRL